MATTRMLVVAAIPLTEKVDQKKISKSITGAIEASYPKAKVYVRFDTADDVETPPSEITGE